MSARLMLPSRAALVIFGGLTAAVALIAPAHADDPVVTYDSITEDGDTAMNCNDLNATIAAVTRDISLLQDQQASLQSVIDQGPQEATQSDNDAIAALGAAAAALGDAAEVDAEDSMPDVQNSLATAQGRRQYLISLLSSCQR